jgi:hypothetical protein
MPLYHSSPVLLGPNSIVLPGNYGRIIRETGKEHPLWKRERELEEVRKQRFPAKPSRLASTFSCTNLDTARYYMNLPTMQGNLGMKPVLYEVEKVDADAPEHIADFNVTQPLHRRPETMSEIATLYWTAGLWTTIVDAPGIRCEEFVTTSPLRIVTMIDPH